MRRTLTAALPGAGGTFRSDPDTFVVDELPLYEACGDGHHLYLRVRKRGLTTREVVRRACDVFGAGERDVGYAGLKDKYATTTQTISVLGVSAGRAKELAGDGLEILDARLHKNKLRVGHLAGNRFEMVVRGPFEGGVAAAADRARAVLDVLERLGLPNFYGEQRFGRDGENVPRALAVARGGRRPKGRWKARLLASALQSHLFNAWLTARMDDDLFTTVLGGDVLIKTDSGGPFVCTEPPVDQPRLDAWEVSISGPIYGPKMRRPGDDSEAAARETAVLESAELTLDDLRRFGKDASGTRRTLRARVLAPSAAVRDDDLILTFSLPPGSYATVLCDEVIRPAGG